MKALIVSNMYPSAAHPAFGVFVERITKQMQLRGIEIDLVVRFEDGNKLISYACFYLRAFLSVLRTDANFVYAHFATHSFLPLGLALLFRRQLPLVMHVHGSDIVPEETTTRLKAHLLRLIALCALSKSDLVVAPSDYFRKLIASDFNIAPGKIAVSPSGGVDIDRFASAVLPPSGGRIILFLGRLIRGKGVLDIFPALTRVESEMPDGFELWIAGDGPLAATLKAQASLAGWPVRMLGAVRPDAVPAVFHQCHAVIFPSHRKSESLGLVALEALSCGRPVIAARNGVMDELISEDINGFKFDAGSVEGFAEAIKKFLRTTDDDLSDMAKSARCTALSYSSEVVSRNLHDLLAERFS